MSDTSVESKYCKDELQKAIYNRKTVLPVLLQTYTRNYPDNLPEDLSVYMGTVQFIDLRQGYNDLSKLWGAINRVTDRSISFANRWILYNQFEILRMLYKNSDHPGNASEYENYQEIISAGYEWNYDLISEHIAPPMEYGDSEEVIRILEMYRAIDNACNRSIDCSEINSPFLRFIGFDGNNEVEYYSFAKYIIEDEGKFAESGADSNSDLNSHFPMLPQYRKMLKQWQLSENPFSLTKEDVIRILNV